MAKLLVCCTLLQIQVYQYLLRMPKKDKQILFPRPRPMRDVQAIPHHVTTTYRGRLPALQIDMNCLVNDFAKSEPCSLLMLLG